MRSLSITLFFSLFSLSMLTSIKASGALVKKPLSETKIDSTLKTLYKRHYNSEVGVKMLKEQTLSHAQKSVPALIEVMKSADYPDKNRWIATFMLGRIMGKNAGEFISKFTQHPNWMLRLAALKTLLALDQKQYQKAYVRALKDDAMIIRLQALENIKRMRLKTLAPYVWAMLYDKTNYIGQDGAKRRQDVIKKAVSLMGDLEFKKVRVPMNKMVKSDKYKDLHAELNYALAKLN